MATPQTKIEDHSNRNIKTIHINKQIANDSTHEPMNSTDAILLSKITNELLAINGISSVSISKYSIDIEKGEMFSWEDIIDKATKILITATKNYQNDLD